MNFQDLKASKSFGNYCAWTDFPLRMTNRGKATLVAEMHLMKEVYAFDLGVFFWTDFLLELPTTMLLVPMPSIIPASSIFHWFSGLMSWTSGRARRLN